MVKTVLGDCWLWSDLTKGEAPKQSHQQNCKEIIFVDEDKWFQEDQQVLFIIQNSQEVSVWRLISIVKPPKIFERLFLKTFMEIPLTWAGFFEVQKFINDFSQEDMEFT